MYQCRDCEHEFEVPEDCGDRCPKCGSHKIAQAAAKSDSPSEQGK